MSLPQKLPLDLMQTKWASQIDPVLSNPLNDVKILKNILLVNGSNVINHKLQRTMQGWFLTDINASANIYRSGPFNNTTLTLISNAVATVSIGVF